jgi:hypothetical protein
MGYDIFNIVIYSDFFGFRDLIKLTKINKETYGICQKYITTYYKTIEHFKGMKIPKLSFYDDALSYNIDYWDMMFNKKLNSNELALYYSYIFLNLHLSSTIRDNRTVKQFMAYPNGCVKQFPNSNGSLTLDHDAGIIWVIITAFFNFHDFQYYDVIIEYKCCTTHTVITNDKFNIDLPTLKNVLVNRKVFDLY